MKTTTTSSRLPQTLRRIFDRFRGRWRLLGTARGVLLSVAIAAAAVGLAIAADRLFRLGGTNRTVLLVAIIAVFAFCVARWVIYRIAKRIRDREAAVRLGRPFPQAEEDMVSAVELSENGRSVQGASPGLVASALEQIQRRTETVNHKAAVPLRPLLDAAAIFVALAVAIATAYLLRPEAVGNALHRLLMPGSDVPYYCYTNLAVLSGDRVVCRGDAAEVTGEISGKRRPDEARLEAQNGGEMLRVDLPVVRGIARWKSGALFDDLRYRMKAGDAISPWYNIRVVPPPSLRNKSAVLRSPKYAGSAETIVKSIQGPLQIIAGTAVKIGVRPVDRGPEPRFRCQGRMTQDQQTWALQPGAGGLLHSPLLTPSDSGDYEIVLTDGFGLASRSPDSVFIKVNPDAKPRVTVVQPDRDVIALPGDTIEVQAGAEDDLGLRELGLTYRTVKDQAGKEGPKSGRWEQRKLLDGGIQTRSLSGKTELSLEELGLEPGQTLEYKAAASDYADQAVMRQAFSRTYRVIVLSEMEHLARMLEKLRLLQIELLRRAAAEDAEAERAGALAKQAKARPVSDQARQAQQRQFELTRSTEDLARDFEALIPELARNPSSPISLLQDLEKLGRAVRGVAQNPMTDMIKSLGKASQAKAAAQQPAQLKAAQGQGEEAAKQLRDLARVVERIARMSLLEKLAAEAERLAARQGELKDTSVPVALKATGSAPESLGKELERAIARLAKTEESIKTDVDSLGKKIDKAAGELAASKPADAATAEQAGEKLESDKVSETAADIAKKLRNNVVFSQIPRQEAVATSLKEVAKILRRGLDDDMLEAIAKELDEFIRRQRQINADIGVAIKKVHGAKGPVVLGETQSRLQRDVSEMASALHWLEQELEGFRSRTVDSLSAAATEMQGGAEDLYASALPPGLVHGKKALELLLAARKRFDQERDKFAQCCGGMPDMKILLLLQRILIGQKRVNKDTADADQIRTKNPQGFDRKVLGLTKRQSGLRLDAGRLEQLLAEHSAVAADLVGKAGGLMDVSRIALGTGDTGEQTRIVQRQIVAILELFLKECQGCMGGGLCAVRTGAIMGMMPGPSPGGFYGGQNAPILPARLGQVDEEDWRTVRSRFEKLLGAAFEGEYPAEYRAMLNAYFERLRSEPPR